MGSVAPWQLILLLVVALLLFGAKRLPEIGRSLGSGMREFKDSVTGKDDEPPPQPPAASIDPPAQAAYTPPPAEQATSRSADQ